MLPQTSKRIRELPPYLFAEIDRLKAEVASSGVDIVDLGVGDPDLPTPSFIIDRLAEAARDPANHTYPSYSGMTGFRKAVARWYQRRFGVTIDVGSETLGLIGSKEGIANFPYAYIDRDDVVLYTEPGYPVYRTGTLFAGGEPYPLPLLSQNNFLPDLDSIPGDICQRAKILWINYPNNPTSAVAPLSFLEDAVTFCRENGIVLAHDAAYTEVYTSDEAPPSILQIDGAKEVAIEFHSLSKTFNMTGWRLAMAVGNAEAIAALGKIKTNVDSGQFQAVQWAGATALDHSEEVALELNPIYHARRQAMEKALATAGLHAHPSSATFYLWVPLPKGLSSAEFCGRLLREQGLVVTPGNGFGPSGEGYFRISLTTPEDRLALAADRIAALSL